ncbi:IPT/TIG domain-containing protein [Catellatospora sp. KI3]|uniref:IPT/TIG domain-containing protein n=1 Tax=Catellatospora sp. KI3 TaxID=3041620 RepID=UPI002482300E|nr:IPT/TIG domain-containing protein [Catellatospora sp. KI3]MDI1462229.1 IPT/TIG domain-containing protein [Catellatospora sp. KI3]
MPTVTGLSCGEFYRSGGNEVTVEGSGFKGASRVYFRDQNLKEYDAQSFKVISDSRLTLIAPKVSDLGTFHIYVIANGQKSTTPETTVTVPDGDTMAATGTFGVTNTTTAGNHNKILSVYAPGSLDEFGKRDLISEIKKHKGNQDWMEWRRERVSDGDLAWFDHQVQVWGQA